MYEVRFSWQVGEVQLSFTEALGEVLQDLVPASGEMLLASWL